MAAPAFRAVTAKAYGVPTSGDNTDIPVDSSIQDGDIMVLAVLAGGSGNNDFFGYATSTPSGWTPLGSPLPNGVNDGSFGLTLSVFWRKAASEPSSYTVSSPGVSGNGAPRTAALLFAVSGAQNAAPSFTFNFGSRNRGPSYPTSRNVTALSIDAPADSLVAFLAHNWDLYSGAQTVPSGSTPTFTQQYKSATNLLYLATGPFAAGGATGDKVQSDANDADNPWHGLLLAFSSAASSVFNPLSGRGGGAAQPLV